eukprot:1652589-Ditylum_brightwellii.AAC.1
MSWKHHGCCHHLLEECNHEIDKRKHYFGDHHITEEDRLRKVHFVKDTKRHAKRHSKGQGVNAREMKDLNLLVNDK